MANNYTQLSFEVELPNGAAETAAGAINLLLRHDVDWGLEIQQLADAGFDEVFPDFNDSEAEAPASPASKALAVRLYRMFRESNMTMVDDVEGDIDTIAIDLVAVAGTGDDNSLYLYSEESGDAEGTAELVCMLIREYGLGPVAFEYAFTCSRPVTGQFGGGAAFCTADGVEYTSTDTWVREQFAAHDAAQNPSAPAP